MIALPELQLQRLVARSGFIREEPDRAARSVRVCLEEIDRIRTWRRVSQCGARGEVAAYHAAQINRVGGHGIREPASLALLQIRDERAVGVPAGGRQCGLPPAGAKRRVEDRRGGLARQTGVGEAVDAGCLVDGEVPLRLPEVLQESVLEDVHLVQIVAAPQVAAGVGEIARLERRIAPQLALEADAPV